MKIKERLTRFLVCVVLAGAIASQIPSHQGVVLAQELYPRPGASNNDVRDTARFLAGLVLAAGLYDTLSRGQEAPPPLETQSAPPVTGTNEKPRYTIYEIISSRADTTEYARLIDLAGMADELRKPGRFTALVPQNTAFENLPEDVRRDLELPDNRNRLVSLLSSHILEGTFTVEQLKGNARSAREAGFTVPTINGGTVKFRIEGEVLYANDVRVSEQDIVATNGIVHPLSSVMGVQTPPTNTTPPTDTTGTPPPTQ